MKIILSRKGFDSKYGGCASPILPDGTLLSMPIPTDNSDGDKYCDISYDGKTYKDIWCELSPRCKKSDYCHLDPDIRPNVRLNPVANWKPAFGQIDGAQTHLHNQKVDVGDLFLFFGWFRQTELNNGILQYDKKADDKHIIYGYLQIGQILTGEEIKEYSWHPHSEFFGDNNTLYLASDNLLGTDLPGAGVLQYSDELCLTKKGLSRSRWVLPDFFRNVEISHHNSSNFKNGYFQSANIGQEFVIAESNDVTKWAKSLIKDNLFSNKA